MQGLRGRLHLQAQPSEEQVQGMRGHLHLRAQPSEEQMQGLWGRLHLRAQPSDELLELNIRGAAFVIGADARNAGEPPSASTTE